MFHFELSECQLISATPLLEYQLWKVWPAPKNEVRGKSPNSVYNMINYRTDGNTIVASEFFLPSTGKGVVNFFYISKKFIKYT